MEQLPTPQELHSYSTDRLLASIRQHEQNIAMYLEQIEREKERMSWLDSVIKMKQELVNGNNNVR